MSKSKKNILLVTGISGAGTTTALKTLEDAGYMVIDNMPLRLVPALVQDSAALPNKLALGVDIRTHDIATHFTIALESIKNIPEIEAHVLFLHADDEILLRRFKETRRKHPLHDGRPVLEIVALERQVVDPIRQVSDTLLDTSQFKPADLRRYLLAQFGEEHTSSEMAVFIMSFGFKHGLPKEADVVFDVRFLKNPYYNDVLRPKTGLEDDVKAYIAEDENLVPTLDNITSLLRQQLPAFHKEGKAYLTIAVGCTGGKHRSVMTVEELSNRFKDLPFSIRTHHRDIENPAG